MSYIKFALLGASTGASILKREDHSGTKFPGLSKLEIWFQDYSNKDWWYGVGPDTKLVLNEETNQMETVPFESDPETDLYVITLQELADAAEASINLQLEEFKLFLYEKEKNLRQQLLTKYDVSAMLAGVYKYEQAKTYKVDPTASVPDLIKEATIRGVDVDAMATRIIDNHESFRDIETKISGVRGKMLDRYNSFVFNSADPKSSLEEFEKTEIVGDKKIGYYSPELFARYKNLG